MLYETGLILRRLALPGLALVLGTCLSSSMSLLEDHTCGRFWGLAGGNDPDGRAVLDVCRDGERLWGLMRVEGRAGLSVSEVVGTVDPRGRIRLVDIDAVVDAPRAGWRFCFDDVFDLEWDPITRQVSGHYTSELCDDAGFLRLRAR